MLRLFTILRTLLFLLVLAMPSLAEAAGCAGTGSCFWIGGSGNWSSTTNWATTSGGATTGSIPTATDDAIFDTLSNATAYTVTLDTAVAKVCKTFTMGAPLSGKVTWAGTQSITISGNLNLSGGTAGITRTYTGAITFNSTTAQTITMSGITLASAITFNGVSGQWQCQDTFTTTGAGTLTNGTFDLNGKAITMATFQSNNSNARTITAGGGTFTVTGIGSVWNLSTLTLFTLTNALTVTANDGSASARTIVHGATGGSESNAVSFKVTAGTGNVTTTTGGVFKDLIWTGFNGTWLNGANTFYGSLTCAWATGPLGGALTFAATSGTQTITSNGLGIDSPITINGSGGTTTLADSLNLSLGTARAFTLTNGTFNTANKAVSTGTFVTAVGTKTLTLGSTVWTLSGTGTVFNNVQNANFTTTANTGTFKTTDASGGTLTLVGGGRNWNGASLWLAGAGTELYTITGANTFADIKLNEGTTAHTITFPNSTTTVTTFTVLGAATKLVTLQRTGASGTWTLASSVDPCTDYLSISNSTASPAAHAGANTTDGGGNSAWTFTACSPGYSRRTLIY